MLAPFLCKSQNDNKERHENDDLLDAIALGMGELRPTFLLNRARPGDEDGIDEQRNIIGGDGYQPETHA